MDQIRADELEEQNAVNLKRQADAAETYLSLFRGQVSSFTTQRQQLFADLYEVMLNSRKTSMSTSITDATLSDIAKDALLMALAVWPEYISHMDTLA